MIKWIKGIMHINMAKLKEDWRKLGVNFITAGGICLFINSINSLNFAVIMGASWVVTAGFILIIIGSQDGDKS